MIVRIVKMTFRPEECEPFIPLFQDRKQRIRGFEGCLHLELWRDSHDPCIFFTYSHWAAHQNLDHYRFSEFFKETWQLTKAKFAAPAQAWSVDQLEVLP
jgi:quinol monooxygenase YgiN